MLISVPEQKVRGAATDALVEFVDIYPALAELCSLPAPADLEGSSFVRLLEDSNQPWKTAAFSVYEKQIPDLGMGYGHAMRTDRYRFIEWAVPGKDKKYNELYDHKTDPQENTNIAGLPETKELVAKLSKQLAGGWKQAIPPPAK